MTEKRKILFMHKNVARRFCARVGNPAIYGDIFGILKIRLSKQAFHQTPHVRIALAILSMLRDPRSLTLQCGVERLRRIFMITGNQNKLREARRNRLYLDAQRT